MSPPGSPLFPARHEFFVGIDSDGCAFDTMEVKHKECFIPAYTEYLGLAAVAKFAREAAEFVNLYSKDRGLNRFPAYLKSLDLLRERPEVRRRGFDVPRWDALRAWLTREKRPSNPALAAAIQREDHPELKLALAWSEAVNRAVERIVRDVPPFPMVRETLGALAGRADVMVVSATPGEALRREWAEHGLADSVAAIAGQEAGAKRDLLAGSAVGRYARDRILMVGDAPGDRAAAEAHGVLFYPIEPGREDESWQRFHDEALPRFLAGTYEGDYMTERIARFEAMLPERPPWAG